MEWLLLQIGCQQHHLFLWLELFHLWVEMGPVYLMGWTGGYVLLALLLAPYLRKFGKFTVPDFIGDRYYSNIARLVAVICLIFISFTYIAGQMEVWNCFSRFLEVDINTGVIIGMAIVFIYAVFRWDERNYLYSSRSILCFNFRLYGASNLYFYIDDWQSNSAVRVWF